MATEIKFSDSLSVATTFATKLLAGTLNHYIDFNGDCSTLQEVWKVETWFSTDVIARLRMETCDMEISRLVPTDIVNNPDSMGSEGEIRSIALYAYTTLGEEVEVATFDVERDWLDGERATGWTNWRVTKVTVTVTEQPVELVSEDYEGGGYLADVLWGRQVYPY